MFFVCERSKRMYLCGFVAFSVRVCVAGLIRLDGTMS